MRRGILPSVYLYAVDERIYKYKHAVARGARLKKYAMLNLCARKWGLAISITRFVHFGEIACRTCSTIQVCGTSKCGAIGCNQGGRDVGGVVSRDAAGLCG